MMSSKVYCLLISLLLFHASISKAQDYQLSFLSVEDGLSHNEVTSIEQDHYGFMWFGTRGGLNRFDGYDFKHYKPSVSDSNSILNPSIESMYLNSNKEICIGFKSGGPSKYINSQENFKEIKLARQYGLNRVLSFFEDSKGNTWIGSWSNGVLCIKNDTVIHYKELTQVRDFEETEDGKIWIASSDGLRYVDKNQHLYNYRGRSVTSIAIDKEGSCLWVLGWAQELMRVNYKTLEFEVFENNLVEDIRNFQVKNDSQGRLWIGTWGNGLYRFDKAEKRFEKVAAYPLIAQSAQFDYDVIRSIYEDKVGDIWLGTQAGIVRISAKNNFKKINITNKNLLDKKHVSAVFEAENGLTWVGTTGNGLYYSDDKITFNKVISTAVNDIENLSKGSVRALHKGPNSKIWVCFERGIYEIEKSDFAKPILKTVNKYFIDSEISLVRKVHELYFDDNQLWIATQQRGVFLFEKKGSKYRLQKHFRGGDVPGMLRDNRVSAIQKDLSGNMWFATYKGLFMYNNTDSTFLSLNELGVSSALACDILLCLELDRKGDLWFGTPCSLNKLELAKTPTLHTFNRNDGLSDDYVSGIVEGGNGLIWFSSNAGISCINPNDLQILNFDRVDGIGDVSYSEGSYHKGSDGTIFFGGYTSLTYFNPENIKLNDYKPPIVISRFSIFNKEIGVNDKLGILKSNINDVKELVLSHNEMEFSFQLASLDYKAPSNNQYAYRLLGSDTAWVEIGNQRHISFTNLKPDDYQLQIKASNSNGIWNDEIKKLNIVILPAPWKSAYAIVGYVLFILLIVFVIIRTALRQERLQGAIEMERVQRNQIKEINDYKLRFFTNISHEFRTPLTLILGPIKELSNKDFSEIKPGFFKERVEMIAYNTKRLYQLVNQLLEFRKMESGKVKLSVSENNLKEVINKNSFPFEQLAKTHAVRFSVNYEASDQLVFIDTEKISVVLTNLLSNAFKHVSGEGKVKLEISDDEKYYKIDISNEGKAIPESEIKHLFERFYQVKGNSSLGSSGIGLQLVKAFTELHEGKVSVSSKEGEPVVFSILLKKGKDHFSEEELFVGEKPSVSMTEPVLPLAKTSVNKGSKGATVLIVEDNIEVRQYLVQLFSENYKVVEAVDGYEGFDKAIEFKPELVLSDVMMPRMDGYELCEKIKTNDLIHDIPVVLLTAKGSDSEHLFGKQKGADLYIKKPFTPDVLLEEVKQLIASRIKLKDKYAEKIVLETQKEEIISSEAVFLKNAIKVVDKHIKESDFTPDLLADELAMSPSSFYRKIKKTSNLTPAGFIKSLRLKKAAQLLSDTDLTVSEIIENVGYLDARSFRKNFKDQFGDTPTEYRKINSK